VKLSIEGEKDIVKEKSMFERFASSFVVWMMLLLKEKVYTVSFLVGEDATYAEI
jgi:hypothetical protein